MSLKGSAHPGQKLVGRINPISILTISAYGVAVQHGFKGTEEEWLRSLEMTNEEVDNAVAKYLAENPVAIDATLSKSGEAADAKVTGDAINALKKTNKDVVDTHVNNKENPHGVTAAQVGARPSDWMPTAEDVKARPATWTPSASDVGARPNTWTPTAQEVGARPSDWMPTAEDVGAVTAEQVTNIVNAALGVIENGTY